MVQDDAGVATTDHNHWINQAEIKVFQDAIPVRAIGNALEGAILELLLVLLWHAALLKFFCCFHTLQTDRGRQGNFAAATDEVTR